MSRSTLGLRGPLFAGLLPAAMLACSNAPTTVETQPTALLIEPANVELESGSTQALRLIVIDAAGRRLTRIPAGASVVWDTDEPSVAAIDENGVLSARLPGEVEITARISYTAGGSTPPGGNGSSQGNGPPDHARGYAKVHGGEPEMMPLVPTELTGVAGELSPEIPTIQLVDAHGKGISDVPIQFLANGGTAQPPMVYTDNNGVAAADWRFGADPGVQTLSAEIPELTPDGVTFQADVSGGASGISEVHGDDQAGIVGAPLPQTLSVIVAGEDGGPIGGVTVTWSTGSGGSISPARTTTGSDGRASATWTLGTAAGSQVAAATVGLLEPVVFTAAAAPGPPTQVQKAGGDAQSAAIGSALPSALGVIVRDAYGNPVNGVRVLWATMTSGAGTVTASNQHTDGSGAAGAQWTLGEVPGEHYVQAAVDGVDEVLFSATALADGGDGECSAANVVVTPAGPLTFTALEDTIRLAATASAADGSSVEGVSYAWRSSNTAVAEVGETGAVVAKTAGTALVVASVVGCNTESDPVNINVAPVVALIAVSPGTLTLQVGQSAQIAAEPQDRNGYLVEGAVETYAVSNPAVIAVDPNGVVTGISSGTAEVTVHSGKISSIGLPINVADGPPPPVGQLVSFPSPEVEAILGPQIVSGSSANPWPWFDENASTKGHQHGQVFPSSPAGQDIDLFLNRNYYDQALTQYINYYRTGDPAFLSYARKITDSWWLLSNIDQGRNRDFGNSLAPRGSSLGGLMLRALDGRPEMWDWITDYTRYMLDIWVMMRVNNTTLHYGVRDGGYMLTYAAWLAQVHPDPAIRQEFREKALIGARDYYARLQYADGSWRWSDGIWPAGDMRMQPFMVGLLLEGMVEVHQMTGDATVGNAIVKSVEALFRDGYRGSEPVSDMPGATWRGMWYSLYGSNGPTGSTSTPENWELEGTRQLNPTTVHAFGYAYKITGDDRFRQWGDEIFAATFGRGQGPMADQYSGLADAREKEYAQSYRSAGRYLAWRSGN